MAGALNTNISVIETSAAEGGAWGIALLAAFILQSKNENNKQVSPSLEQFLNEKVFANLSMIAIEPNPDDTKSFKTFMDRYTAGLKIEKAAIENLKR
jgi:sugar (pentulose or hexulose) kinase